jgi:hypothetical protein
VLQLLLVKKRTGENELADKETDKLDYVRPGPGASKETRVGFRLLAGFFALCTWILLGLATYKGIERDGFEAFISSLDAAEMAGAAIFALALSAVCLSGR